jgi:3-oxoacyl-[acyl-carrier protein] reductase
MQGNRAALAVVAAIVLVGGGWLYFNRTTDATAVQLVPMFASAQKQPPAGPFAVIDANLRGAIVAIRAATRGMMKRRWGRIINISSVVGLVGNKGQSNSAASKAGLIGLTKSVAKEFASRNILANAIAPGFIETDMTGAMTAEARAALTGSIPLERLGSPTDIAAMVVFLASDHASYITGQVLVVDGGMVM